MSGHSDNKSPFTTPLGIFVISIIILVVTISTLLRTGLAGLDTSGYFFIGLSFLSIMGIVFVAWGFRRKFLEDGIDEAIHWFINREFGEKSKLSSNRSSSNDKVPPATEKKKNQIKFERAERSCEFCGKQSDHLEIHHIKPRSSGGTNKMSNLIALCPECHRKADNSVYSQSELRYQLRKSSNRMRSEYP